MFFETLTQKSGFDKDIIKLCLSFRDKIYSKQLEDLFFEGYDFCFSDKNIPYLKEPFYPHEFFASSRLILQKNNIPLDEGYFYLYVLFMQRSYEEYQKNYGDNNLFFDTAKSVLASAKHHKSQKGTFGLYDYIWFSNHIKGSCIRLGTFEYQLCKYSGKKISVSQKSLCKGDFCLYLHVPVATDLSKESRFESYEKAKEFFGDNLFLICDSWLLYEGHIEKLPQSSNIKSFYNDFEIISTTRNKGFEDAKRVFGEMCDFSDISGLPDNTLLQKIYIERFKNGLFSGSAIGVRIL